MFTGGRNSLKQINKLSLFIEVATERKPEIIYDRNLRLQHAFIYYKAK